MRALIRAACLWLAVIVVAGCASSEVTSYRPPQGRIERPDRILVYDFAATADELPADVAIAGRGAYVPRATASQLAVGRELGKRTAQYLVEDLRQAGLPAYRAAASAPANVGDGIVVGYFTTIDPGDATQRMVVGFGQGAPSSRPWSRATS